jgi:hypothetical protein
MTECDVVHVAGQTTQMQVATNERGERTLVLTYPSGQHPGIYRFTSGILKSIEQVPEAERPAKPARRAHPKKRAAPRPAPQAAAAPATGR